MISYLLNQTRDKFHTGVFMFFNTQLTIFEMLLRSLNTWYGTEKETMTLDAKLAKH